MRQTFNEAAYSVLQLIPVKEQPELFARFVYESGRAACETGFWFLDPKGASKVEQSMVNCPVLVTAGTQDRITPASIIRKVADKYGGVSTYKEFTNHAHWLIGEPDWQEVAEYASDWLNQALSKTR